MKLKRVISLAASLLCAASLTLSSGASVLGDVYYSPTISLSDALDYTQVYAYDGEKDKNTRAYILEYNPSSDETLPLVTCGGSVYGRKTLDTMIGYKLRDPNKLAAAVNADFFSMKTGVPMGVVVEGGIVFSGPENENAFVITEDGAASITTADIKISMSVAGRGSLDIDYFNKYPTKYGTYLLNSFYGKTTASTLDSREIVMKAEGDPYITPRGTVTATVSEIRDGVSDTSIPSGCFVLSYAKTGTSGGDALLAALSVGDKITFTSNCTGLPENVRLAVGGGDVILRGGVYDEKLADEEHETLRNPRTAVGIRADGTVVFFACDGRRTGFSDGLTLADLAAVMLEYGCVDALNLDGGGSTTVVIGSDGIPKTVNRPTEGGQRKISNAILFVNSDEYIARDRLTVTPDTAAVLTGGSSAEFTASYDGAAVGIESLSAQLEERAAGSFADGVFTSGNYVGETKLTLRTEIGGRVISGEAEITVVDRITALTLGASNMKSGETQTLSLSA
ncbi:MAG: phosphodiester glycosidase family protein, partial [Eubacteriales bacterium]